MAYLPQVVIERLKDKLTTDLSHLGKLYVAKKSSYQIRSIDHSLVDGFLSKGWEIYGSPLKTKTRIRKIKSHSKQFEDDIWCQLYELGYRYLNYDDTFYLPFSGNEQDKKQIDVIAIDNDAILLIECKSSETRKKAPSYKEEFDALSQRLDGFKKVLKQAFGSNIKVKYIFATRNMWFAEDSVDLERLKSTNSFYYSDNTYKYVNNLISNYKTAARYQFLGLIFKNELINTDRIEIPAVEGRMGGKTYYMFSIEPELLLKMGFILHRVKANESEMPTYQRLLVPKRLPQISKFIEDGGFFPNSVIINFSQMKHKVRFVPSSRSGDSQSRLGMLQIPNAYAIAYIIDGQHRVYGYANTKYKRTNTMPVVAFTALTSIEQLEIFMEINQNQKAVKPSLRLTLEEDLFWDSDRADSRLKALRSSIIKELSNSANGPLFNRISIGEDDCDLTFAPFSNALIKSGLLPSAKGNQYIAESLPSSLYNVNNYNHSEEMNKSRKNIVQFLNYCYGFVAEHYPNIFERERYFIVSNRGTFAYISLIGSLNRFVTEKGEVNYYTIPSDRFAAINKYLKVLLDYLNAIPQEDEAQQLALLGASADIKWLRFFQTIINNTFHDYEPAELIDWKERQDDQLQNEGRSYGVKIEKYIKDIVLSKLQLLFGDNWELEITPIKLECMKRAEEENEKNYKEGLSKRTTWTEMFSIIDYKTIILKYWDKTPKSPIITPFAFKTYREEFSIDIGEGLNGQKKATKWISYFNSYRNLWAHEGTKEKRLNREEVSFLLRIHRKFYNNIDFNAPL